MKMSGAEEAAAAAPAGGVARACAWSGAGGGGGGAGGGAAAAVDVVDDDAGRFATAARARAHHLLKCLCTPPPHGVYTPLGFVNLVSLRSSSFESLAHSCRHPTGGRTANDTYRTPTSTSDERYREG